MATRSRKSILEWQEIIHKIDHEGLDKEAYAKELGYHPSTFNYWRKKIKNLQGDKGSFVELRAAPSDTVSQSTVVSVTSPQGWTVSWPQSPEPSFLRQLMAGD